MKIQKIIIVIAFIFCFAFSQAQQVVPAEEKQSFLLSYVETRYPDNVYFQDTNNILDKYIGNWVYDDGTHFFEINISLIENRQAGFSGRTEFNDLLIVRYRYVENGIEVYNILNDNERFAMRMLYAYEDNRTSFHYEEPTDACTRANNAYLRIDYLPEDSSNGTPETLNWQRLYFNSLSGVVNRCPDGTSTDDSPLRIPEEMTLSRQ